MIDIEGLNELEASLAAASRQVQMRTPGVLDGSARRVRDDARRLAPRRMLPHYANTITYQLTWAGTALEAEIGPEKGGQGSLGHILEYGSANNGPHAHHGPALDLEEPRFVEDMARLGGDVL